MPIPITNIPNLTDTQKTFASLVENQIALNTAVNDIREAVNKHHKLLIEGNGEIPLLERVRSLEAFMIAIKFWLRTVAVSIVAQTVTFGIAILVAVVKFLPALEKLANP